MRNSEAEGCYSRTKPSTLKALVQDLRRELDSFNVLTPGSEGYSDSIKRWSDGVEKKAVRASLNRGDEGIGSYR